MMSALFSKLSAGIFSVLMSIAGFFGQVPVENLGEQFAVGGETYFLSGSGITSTQTTIDLTKFGYTKPDKSYQKFNLGNFGTLGCGTIQPGNNSGKQEFVSFTGITQNTDGTAQLTGVSRGLERFPPYSASTTLQTNHAGGSLFVVANSPPCFYEGYANRTASTTITARWNYDILPQSTITASTSNQFVNKSYVDNTNNSGAATSTETNGGIVELATRAEQASSTGAVTDALVLQARNSTSTPGANITAAGGVGETYAVISEDDGKINQNFLDLAENFDFGGRLSVGSSSPQTTGLTVGATTTTANLFVSSSTIAINNQYYKFPSFVGASSSALLRDSSGNLTWNVLDMQELADVTLSSASSTWSISVSNRKIYEIRFTLEGDAHSAAGMTFNNVNGGADWLTNFSIDSAASSKSNVNNYCQLGTSQAFEGKMTFNNSSTTLKTMTFETINASSTASVPTRTEGACAYPNPAGATINTIDFFKASDSFHSGDRVIIYGSKN